MAEKHELMTKNLHFSTRDNRQTETSAFNEHQTQHQVELLDEVFDQRVQEEFLDVIVHTAALFDGNGVQD